MGRSTAPHSHNYLFQPILTHYRRVYQMTELVYVMRTEHLFVIRSKVDCKKQWVVGEYTNRISVILNGYLGYQSHTQPTYTTLPLHLYTLKAAQLIKINPHKKETSTQITS